MKHRVRAVLEKDGYLTLIHRIKGDTDYFVFPGGGVEDGESHIVALKREMLEELGVIVECGPLLFEHELLKDTIREKEFFYSVVVTGGMLGTGEGSEFSDHQTYEGTHHVVKIPVSELPGINLLPQEAKDRLLEEYYPPFQPLTNSIQTKGLIDFGGIPVFFKSLSLADYHREKKGYELVRRFYPVPLLLWSYHSNDKGVLVFEYEPTIRKNRGLLVDLFATGNCRNEDFRPIIDLFQSVFLNTLAKNHGHSCDVFFKDRVQSRLLTWYDERFVKEWSGADFTINGHRLKISISNILKQVADFFSESKEYWCVVSQCDPNDLNVGTKPVLLDFLGGGLNPLMAEYATLVWYQVAQGSCLAPVYNPRSFAGHEKILGCQDKIIWSRDELSHTPSKDRLNFLRLYTEEVVIPCMRSIPRYSDWYEEFKNYLALKALGVFQVSKMDEEHLKLSLGYLQYFYDLSLRHPEDLLVAMERLWHL